MSSGPNRSGGLPRIAALVALILAVPIVPFLAFGETLDRWVIASLDESVPAWTVAGLIAAVLASDVVLPVPSSFVSTFGGARLGIAAGTAVSWLGMTAGAAGGFALARWVGWPLARRLARGDDLERLADSAARHGPMLLAATRAIPILAEASVLWAGAMRLSWGRFLAPVVLSNLGIALVYSMVGRLARDANALPAALVASIAFPLAATAIARVMWKSSSKP